MKSTHPQPLPLIYTILDSPAFGGAEQYVLSNLRYLSQQGYPVCVATNNAKVREQFEMAIRRYRLQHFEVIQFPFVLDAIGNWKGLVKFLAWVPLAWMWQAWIFWRFQRRHQPVVCYWAGFSDRLLLSPLAKLWRAKLIWIEIGPLEPTFVKNWGFPRLLYQMAQSLPDTLITTSAWTKTSIVKNSAVPASNIQLIYPGVTYPTVSEVTKLKKQGRQWRRDHSLHRKFMISFIGRMAGENEVDVLLRAVQYFSQHFDPNMVAALIGDGPERARFQALSDSLGLQKNVMFTGFVSQNEKLAIVAVSDAFVFARAWELDGFGMTPLEGMSVMVPVITTDFGPQKEIVRHRHNGLAFRPHDPIDLAKKLAQLYQNALLRDRLAQAGRKSMIPTFTEATMHIATLAVIQHLHGS